MLVGVIQVTMLHYNDSLLCGRDRASATISHLAGTVATLRSTLVQIQSYQRIDTTESLAHPMSLLVEALHIPEEPLTPKSKRKRACEAARKQRQVAKGACKSDPAKDAERRRVETEARKKRAGYSKTYAERKHANKTK